LGHVFTGGQKGRGEMFSLEQEVGTGEGVHRDEKILEGSRVEHERNRGETITRKRGSKMGSPGGREVESVLGEQGG